MPTQVLPAELGSQVVAPGCYSAAASAFALTGILTLKGAGSYIFVTPAAITTAASSIVRLSNGAQCSQVKWCVGAAATLGAQSTFSGSITSQAAITLGAGAIVHGSVKSAIGVITYGAESKAVACAAAALALHASLSAVAGCPVGNAGPRRHPAPSEATRWPARPDVPTARLASRAPSPALALMHATLCRPRSMLCWRRLAAALSATPALPAHLARSAATRGWRDPVHIVRIWLLMPDCQRWPRCMLPRLGSGSRRSRPRRSRCWWLRRRQRRPWLHSLPDRQLFAGRRHPLHAMPERLLLPDCKCRP